MIAFATLLLGLIVGPQPVEFLVGHGVESVEVFLDGQSIGRLEGEERSLTADFGPQLRPHMIVGVGYDGQGGEVGRVRQWVNLPRRPAEAAVVLEGGDTGRGVVAHLSWESVVRADPLAIHATFDGRPLDVKDPHRIVLPRHNPEQLHFLRIELEFSENVSSVVEAAFAGTYGDRLSTDLTAVATLFPTIKTSKLPPLAELRGKFLKRGVALPVVAVEKGPADVAIVKTRAAHPSLQRLTRTSEKELRARARLGRLVLGRPKGVSGPSRTSLPSDLGIRFLWPVPTRQFRVGYEIDVFPPSMEFTESDGDLFWLLSQVRPVSTSGTERLADAVAAAGLLVSARNRRRAVVLLVSGEEPDASRFDPAMVRQYLEHLRVPLMVWSVESEEASGSSPWGDVRDVSSFAKLGHAARDLFRQLDHQRVVWLDGAHLPHEIVESSDAPLPESAQIDSLPSMSVAR